MKNTGIRAIAQQLQAQGRGRDKILAHIMPEEAAMLKRMGGSGTVNPKTGLLEFDNPSMGAYDAPSNSVSPGLSGFGGGSSSPGGVSSSGATNPSVGGGGGGGSFYTSGGGRDSSSSNQSPSYTGGGGGGMLTAGTPTMVSSGGGAFTPMGGSSSNYLQSLGVPTIVANTMQSAANVAQSAGQGLLNFSDAATGQYQQMMASPSQYFGSMLPSMPSAAQTGDFVGRGIVSLREALSAPEPAYTPAPSFRSEAAAGGYDFTPAAPATPAYLDPGGSGRMVSPAEVQMFNEMQRERFEDQYGTQPVPAPQPVESIRLDQAPAYTVAPGFRSEAATEAAAAPTYNLDVSSPFGFSSLQTAPLPGTVSGPVTAFGVTPGAVSPTQSVVSTDQLIDAVKSWAPFTTSMMTNEQIKEGLISGLPEGMVFDPRTNTVTNNTGMPLNEAIQTLAGSTVQQFNRDVPVSQFMTPVRGAPTSNFGVATGPTFTANVAQNVAQSLDTEFDRLTTGAPMTAPGMAQTTPSMIDYTRAQMAAPITVGGTPIYAEATPFSGPKGGTVPMSEAARYAGGGVFSDIEELNDLPSGYLGKLYGIESSFGKNLTTPLSSATGPFQFTRATGAQYGLMEGGVDTRMDLLQSAAAAGSLAADNAAALEKVLDRPPSSGELYLAHQQGIAGATSLLTNPNASALSALKRAYGGDENLAMQALVNNGGSLSMTAGQFASMWTSKMDRAPVEPKGGYGGTMFAQLSPTVSQVAQTRGLTSPETTQVAIQTGELGTVLDTGFEEVLSLLMRDLPPEGATEASQDLFASAAPTFVSGGGRDTQPLRETAAQPPAEVPVEQTPSPVYTTGMNLARRTYTPRLPTETISPAYS